jgi:MarR family 2-MHQ and catechol resistance regulon transcriptional repressor
MYQFDVTPDGFIRESAVNAMVSKLKDSFPETDALALEAHLMLGMTYSYLADVKKDFRAKFGITGRRFTVLRLLYLAEGRRLSMGTIAANLEIGTNNTTQLVDGLVRDGLVERMTAPDDKRVIYAVLSKAGAELFAHAFPLNAARLKETWAPLSDREKQLLIHLLSRIRLSLLAIPDAAESLTEREVLAGFEPMSKGGEELQAAGRRSHGLSQPAD